MTHPVNELNEVVPIKIVPAPTLVALNVNGGLSREQKTRFPPPKTRDEGIPSHAHLY